MVKRIRALVPRAAPPLLRVRGCAVALAVCGVACLAAPTASAQDSSRIALDRYEPAPAGDSLLSIPDPTVPYRFRPAAGIVASYARSPLRLATSSADGSHHLGAVVSHQMTMHLQLSADLLRTVKADADLPFTVSQSGQSPSSVASPSGAAWNDVRLGARLVALRPSGAAPAVAVAANAWIPTGNGSRFTGTGELRYGGFVLAGADYRQAAWRAMVGRRRSDAREGQYGLGSDVVFGAGVVWRHGALQAGPELFGSTAANAGAKAFTARTTGMEVLAAARYRLGPAVAALAAGPGFFKSAGTPAWRIVAAIQVAPEVQGCALVTSGSGQAKGRHQMAPPAPSSSHEPPLLDWDGDTVPDAQDDCPRVAGDPRGVHPGCPADRDSDGIADADDACPDKPGAVSATRSRNGCPADSDGDGIADKDDACPRESGVRDADPAKNGCPTVVRVTGTQIVVTQNVNFALGSADLDPASEPVLAQVAQVLREHAEIVRIAVDGHTDNQGADALNLALSRRRAIAVVRWLIAHGVDERRMEARGFGARRPVADNKTQEGRAKNRRVEFLILKRDERGDQVWRDGAVQGKP